MIKETFILTITAKYRAPKDSDNPEQASVTFFNDISDFADKCKFDKLKDAYDYVTQNHDYPTHFPMAFIYKRARKEKWLEDKPRIKKVVWNVCSNCETQYSLYGRGCPKCRCTKASIGTPGEGEANRLPDKIIMVQEDCFYCTMYPESIKKENSKKQYFTNCGDYGKKQDPKCSVCQCKECCTQMMMYRADPTGTTEKYKTTELAQPLREEVQPLNETVKQMVKDIERRI